MQHFYGVKNLDEVKSLAKMVVKGLGGSESVYLQMLGTAATETRCGTYPDSHPEKLGVGLYQHDKINIEDIKKEGEQRHFDIVKNLWGYDISSIELVDLAFDPLLSTICCRLSYKRIPELIPSKLSKQAIYWKKYYNTNAGVGSAEHFIQCVNEVLGGLGHE